MTRVYSSNTCKVQTRGAVKVRHCSRSLSYVLTMYRCSFYSAVLSFADSYADFDCHPKTLLYSSFYIKMLAHCTEISES